MTTPANRPAPTRSPRTELIDFRSGYHHAWTGWPDAAFKLCDAALRAPGPVTSVPG